MVAKRRVEAELFQIKRTFLRVTRALRYAWLLHQLARRDARHVGRYQAACRWSRAWCDPSPAASVRLPSRQYIQLLNVVQPPLDPVAAQRRRRLQTLFQQTSDLCSRLPPAIDPLNARAALVVQGAILRRLFLVLLDVDLDPSAVQIVRRYGSLATATRDFLAHCGYGGYLPSYASPDLDVESFVSFARWRHRRLDLLDAAGAPVASRDGMGPLMRAWLTARAATRQLYWRSRDRQQHANWHAVKAHAYLSQDARRFAADALADRQAQGSSAVDLAAEIHGRGIKAMMSLANRIMDVDPGLADSDAHVGVGEAAVRALGDEFQRTLESMQSL